jgi:aspartate ammonia-lyase
MNALTTRLEHDLLGDREVPSAAYYGVHTLRALENFDITGISIAVYPDLIRALAQIKQAAAQANLQLGLLDAKRTGAIVAACKEVIDGKWHEQFVVDVIQGGAGTSTNMNANEVIANRALEILGHAKGEYQFLHPNEHVNMSQSTNDVYPTALKLATYVGIFRLVEAMAYLRRAFERKAEEFADVLKMGRTQLQDAVPMTLGQEFSTYAVMLGEDEERLREAALLIREMNLGATAIGTGINAHPDYAAIVCRKLVEISGIPVLTAPNLIEATQDCGSFVQLSGVLKRVAVKLSKVCNDLRLLSSGPRAGFNEINLPPRQAGSSIMPGKVNPVIPEVVNQIAFEVIGNDTTVTFRRRSRATTIERLRADHRPQPVQERAAPQQGLQNAGRLLRRRHHRQPRHAARQYRTLDRHRHRAQPLHWLRQRHRGCRRGAPQQPWRRRDRA